MKIEGSRDTTAEVSFSFHLCSCKCLLLSPQCTTIRCIKSVPLKHLGPHKERLVLPDAAVAFLPPEIDLVNHVLNSQCCRHGAEMVHKSSSSRAGIRILSSIPCFCTCVIFVLGFLILAILNFNFQFLHSAGLII